MTLSIDEVIIREWERFADMYENEHPDISYMTPDNKLQARGLCGTVMYLSLNMSGFSLLRQLTKTFPGKPTSDFWWPKDDFKSRAEACRMIASQLREKLYKTV